MKKEKLILIALLGLFFFSLIPSTSAYFFRDHQYWVLKAFSEVESPITEQCRPFIEEVLNGMEGADAGVIHYNDDKVVASYIGLHSKGSGYERCLQRAGSDLRLKCVCIGDGTHIIADSLSHLKDGLVEKTISRWGATNFVGHMIVERNFERKHQQFIANDIIVTSGQLDFYDARVLDLFFDENDNPTDLLDLFNNMAGIDMEVDFLTVRAGYQGLNFFDMAYRDKLRLPFQLNPISWAMIILGLGVPIFLLFIIPVVLKIKLTNWKYLAIIPWIILLIIGATIQISFFTGTTWKVTNVLLDVAGSTGYLRVSDTSVEFYHNEVLKKTKEFLQTGDLMIEDASGLSFVDSNGVFHEGDLSKAEGNFFRFVLPILLVLYFLLIFWTIKRAFGFKGLFRFKRA